MADSYPDTDTSALEKLIESAALLSLAEGPEEIALAKDQFKDILNNSFDQLSPSLDAPDTSHSRGHIV
ncbi:MAG: hypothetical protein ACJAUP_001741 [Cellvibrionaceae bacterium]